MAKNIRVFIFFSVHNMHYFVSMIILFISFTFIFFFIIIRRNRFLSFFLFIAVHKYFFFYLFQKNFLILNLLQLNQALRIKYDEFQLNYARYFLLLEQLLLKLF